MKQKRFISLKLDKLQAEVFARFMSLVAINLLVNPQAYGMKADVIKLTLNHLDYLIHEEAKWCDKSDCSYWAKKRALQEREEVKMLKN